jgi:hypothetical protein
MISIAKVQSNDKLPLTGLTELSWAFDCDFRWRFAHQKENRLLFIIDKITYEIMIKESPCTEDKERPRNLKKQSVKRCLLN